MSNDQPTWMTSEQALVQGLVGDQWRDLYQNNAQFKHAVETLGKMLPMWVEGIALRTSMQAEEQRRELVHLQMSSAVHLPDWR